MAIGNAVHRLEKIWESLSNIVITTVSPCGSLSNLIWSTCHTTDHQISETFILLCTLPLKPFVGNKRQGNSNQSTKWINVSTDKMNLTVLIYETIIESSSVLLLNAATIAVTLWFLLFFSIVFSIFHLSFYPVFLENFTRAILVKWKANTCKCPNWISLNVWCNDVMNIIKCFPNCR